MQWSASEDSEPGFPPIEDAPTAWLDVRSPSEYAAGHVPGAYSLPLLSDSERHQVGLCFKNRGSAEAVDLAWLYLGPKIPWLLQTLRVLSEKAGIGANRSWMVYCWRGGQRSMGMELLVRQAGYPVQRYAGGYKAWRGRMTTLWGQPWRWFILGGRTGSAKTEALHDLAAAGQQVLDLEGLAGHKGSAFGNLGEIPQPSQEHFMNRLAHGLDGMDLGRPVWVESESRQIGSLHLPDELYQAMQQAPYFRLNRSMDFRIRHLLSNYGAADPALLRRSFLKIERKMGPQHCQRAVEYLDAGDLDAAARLALTYYDRTYDYAFGQRPCPDCAVELRSDAMGLRLVNLLIKAGQRVFGNPISIES